MKIGNIFGRIQLKYIYLRFISYLFLRDKEEESFKEGYFVKV